MTHQDKECRKRVCAEGKRRQQETKLQMLWIRTPHGRINWAELSNAHKPLTANSSPRLRRTLPMAFTSGTKTSNKMDLVFPGLNFLNDKQVSKGGNLVRGSPCGLRQAQIYTSEMMSQNHQPSGRLCAFIKSTGHNWKLKVGYTGICGLYHCLLCCYRWCPTRPALSPWSPRCRANRLAWWLHGDIRCPGTGVPGVCELLCGAGDQIWVLSESHLPASKLTNCYIISSK